jgi:hypothetical protein
LEALREAAVEAAVEVIRAAATPEAVEAVEEIQEVEAIPEAIRVVATRAAVQP